MGEKVGNRVAGTVSKRRRAEIARRRALQKRKRQRQMMTAAAAAVVLIAAIGFAGFFAYQQFGKASSDKLVQKGTEFLQEEKYTEAAEQFEKAVSVEQEKEKDGKESVTASGAPYITEAYRGAGMAYYELQDYEQAGKNLQKAVELGGDETPVLYHMLGISAMHLEDYDGALQAFEAGTALLSEGVYTEKDGSEKSVDYSAVIREMKYNRIVCLEKKRDWGNAKAEMEAYTAAYPEDTSVQKEAEFLSTR